MPKFVQVRPPNSVTVSTLSPSKAVPFTTAINLTTGVPLDAFTEVGASGLIPEPQVWRTQPLVTTDSSDIAADYTGVIPDLLPILHGTAAVQKSAMTVGERLMSGLRRFAATFDARVTQLAMGHQLGIFTFFPWSGSENSEEFSTEKVTALAKRVLETLTSLNTLRAHGLQIEYPDNILLAIYNELARIRKLTKKTKPDNGATEKELPQAQDKKTATTLSPRYFLPVADSKAATLADDVISLFTPESLISEQVSAFLDQFLTAIVNSPLTLVKGFNTETIAANPRFEMLARHAIRIAKNGLHALMSDFLDLIPKTDGELPRMVMPALTESEHPLLAEKADILQALQTAFEERNVFAISRVLNFDPTTQLFAAGSLDERKTLDEFYGYGTTRLTYLGQFQTFSQGTAVKPLILFGPPGVGKTQLTNAHAMHFNNLHLVRVPASAILDLHNILEFFRQMDDRRFVLFVDDIGWEPELEEVFWKPFRQAYQGGMTIPPENVMLVIASNQKYPDNVRDRGVYLPFVDIADPKEGIEVILGIIYDYFKRNMSAEALHNFRSQLKARTHFIAQDFYHGVIPVKLKSFWKGDGQRHTFQHSPRGLLNYLESLNSSGRMVTITERIGVYQAHQQALASDGEDLQTMMEQWTPDSTPNLTLVPPPEDEGK